MTDMRSELEALREAHIMICQLCKRLNPQHTGDPDTCSCNDTDFLRIFRNCGMTGGEPVKPIEKRCQWTEDEDGVWDTSCGERWWFDTGTPKENKAKYCMYCGLPLEEVLAILAKYPTPDAGLRAEVEKAIELQSVGQFAEAQDVLQVVLDLASGGSGEPGVAVSILKETSSEWQHDVEVGKIDCHSRMIQGVLCRWWGKEEPAGVRIIDTAHSLASPVPVETTVYVCKGCGTVMGTSCFEHLRNGEKCGPVEQRRK